MYAALFEMASWMGKEQFICRGDTAADVLSDFERIQSLDCLVYMGRSREKAAGQAGLDIIEGLLEKRRDGELTPEDLLTLDVKLSLGPIKCVCIEEGDDAVEKLKAQYPRAR